MGYNNGKVSAPVNVYDVQRALGVGSTDVGTLCRSNRINMWARYKPEDCLNVSSPLSVRPLTLQDRILNGYSIEASLSDGSGSVSRLVERLRNGTQADMFVYSKPRGGLSSPYRLTDFDGYFQNAACPITAPYNPTDKVAVTQQGELQLYYYVSVNGTTYSLGLGDLRFVGDSNQLRNYYFGILIYDNTFYQAATQSTQMGQMSDREGLDVTLIGIPQTEKTYNMVPIFATQPFASKDSSFVGTIVPMVSATQVIQTASESSYIRISVAVYVWVRNGVMEPTMYFWYSVVNNTDGVWNFSTSSMGSGTSFVRVGTPSTIQNSWTINVSAQVPAHQSVSNTVVIADSLFEPYQIAIRNGQSEVMVRAAQYNGEYRYSGQVQMWEDND